MKLWEVVGWLLLVVGLFVFYMCFVLLVSEQPGKIVESVPLTAIGIVIFRGGIHLLKVAAAARLCRGLPPDAVGPAVRTRSSGPQSGLYKPVV